MQHYLRRQCGQSIVQRSRHTSLYLHFHLHPYPLPLPQPLLLPCRYTFLYLPVPECYVCSSVVSLPCKGPAIHPFTFTFILTSTFPFTPTFTPPLPLHFPLSSSARVLRMQQYLRRQCGQSIVQRSHQAMPRGRSLLLLHLRYNGRGGWTS
jgi:hypothetical protein